MLLFLCLKNRIKWRSRNSSRSEANESFIGARKAPKVKAFKKTKDRELKGEITKRTVGALSRALLHKHPKSLIWLMFGTQLAVRVPFCTSRKSNATTAVESYKFSL